MSHLTKYVADINSWNQIFNKKTPKLSINSPVDREKIRQRLECDLSPENLCCDGELGGAALRRKADYLNGALAELNARS